MGPPGPATEVEDAAIGALIQQFQEQAAEGVASARQGDSERLDNLIHLIIQNTQNPEFKERLNSLDREIHRVFETASAAAPDEETVQTFELLEGIVVVSSIMDAIAEARIAAAQEAVPEPAPAKYEVEEYTRYFVKQAIERYKSEGLEATVDYYNTPESVDGQWYMLIIDQDNTMIAHAGNPSLVDGPASAAVGPNNYPAGDAVAAVADEDGEWFSYTFPNPATGGVELKHSWIVEYDGLTFVSGWYEAGPSKADNPAYTRALVQSAISLYDALGRQATVAYYNTAESGDGQWYVFIVDQSGFTISHHNPMFRFRDPSDRVDSTGYFYGDDLLSATDAGRWVDYVLLNPETGDEGQKHTWAVRHDGLIFASGWYEPIQ